MQESSLGGSPALNWQGRLRPSSDALKALCLCCHNLKKYILPYSLQILSKSRLPSCNALGEANMVVAQESSEAI